MLDPFYLHRRISRQVLREEDAAGLAIARKDVSECSVHESKRENI